MSRKARISEEQRKEWACVRVWAATKGYRAYKPPAKGYLHDALVILEHQCPNRVNPMRSRAGLVQELLFNEIGTKPEFSTILVVDMTALLKLRDEDEPDMDIIGEEAVQIQFGKRMEKPVIRFLERIYLRDATIVARGECCQFAIKLMSPVASRALKSENIKRIVMLHPALSPAFINKQLGSRAAAKLKAVELHVAYPSDKERKRRDRILRHYCPKGKSMTWEPEIEQNSVVLLTMLESSEEEKPTDTESTTSAASSPPEYDPERYDHLGQSLFFAEVRIVMDPVSKRDIQVSEDVTLELNEPEESEDEADPLGETNVDIASCTQEVGGLVLRGNRCILCKSLTDEWTGMRVPSLPPDDEDEETPLACAARAVSELCEIDAEEDVVPLPHIQPVNIFMPGGEPVVISLHVFYAVNAPPEGPVAEGLLAADEWDDDYTYDWYTFTRAVTALRERGDEATVVALQALAFALKGAASAGVLPVKWGGVFGQEFTDQLTPGVSRPTGPSAVGKEDTDKDTDNDLSTHEEEISSKSSLKDLSALVKLTLTGCTSDDGEQLPWRPVEVLTGFLRKR